MEIRGFLKNRFQKRARKSLAECVFEKIGGISPEEIQDILIKNRIDYDIILKEKSLEPSSFPSIFSHPKGRGYVRVDIFVLKNNKEQAEETANTLIRAVGKYPDSKHILGRSSKELKDYPAQNYTSFSYVASYNFPDSFDIANHTGALRFYQGKPEGLTKILIVGKVSGNKLRGILEE